MDAVKIAKVFCICIAIAMQNAMLKDINIETVR
jgi:hypothetical protein